MSKILSRSDFLNSISYKGMLAGQVLMSLAITSPSFDPSGDNYLEVARSFLSEKIKQPSYDISTFTSADIQPSISVSEYQKHYPLLESHGRKVSELWEKAKIGEVSYSDDLVALAERVLASNPSASI